MPRLQPRIGFLLQSSRAESPRLSAVTAEIVERLRVGYGAIVDLLQPDAEPFALGDFRPEYDVYVLKAKTPVTLAVAAAAARAGAAVVNTFEASTLARDKIATTAVIAAAGVPVPTSWATGRAPLLHPLVHESPAWLKPQRGSQGAGVRRLQSDRDLEGLDDAARDVYGLPLPLFAQREVPSGGRDLKVYVVGEQMWAISRPFPARTLEEKLGAPARIPPCVREAAIATGAALGLELYGVDFLVAGDEFFAVDVNALPGYKGVPEAPAAIADYLFERSTR